MDGQNFNNGQQNNYQDNTMMYQAPMQGAPQPPQQTNVLAIVSLICGVASIILCCCNWVGILFGIGAIVCAILAKKQGNSGLATAGLVCGIIGCAFSLISLIGAIALSLDDDFAREFRRYYY